MRSLINLIYSEYTMLYIIYNKKHQKTMIVSSNGTFYMGIY